MRIAMVYDRIWPYARGGQERRTRMLADELGRRGHEVLLVGAQEWEGPSVMPDGNVTLVGACPPVIPDKRNIWAALEFARHAMRELPRLDADIMDMSAFPFLHLLRMKGFVARTPTVVNWAEWYDFGWWSRHVGVLRAPAALAMEHVALRMGDGIVAASSFTSDRLRKAGATLPIWVVENAIPLDDIDAAPCWHEGSDVAFVSRLTHEKRVDLIIEALGILRQRGIRLTAAIMGDGYMKRELQAMADRLCPGQVTLTGWVSDDEVYGRLKAAKVLVHPSRQEGFGIVALEAYAAASPVVAVGWRTSAVPTLVRHGETGLVTGTEAADLADALAGLVLDRARLDSMSQEARREALRWTWADKATQLEHAYESVLRNASVAGSR